MCVYVCVHMCAYAFAWMKTINLCITTDIRYYILGFKSWILRKTNQKIHEYWLTIHCVVNAFGFIHIITMCHHVCVLLCLCVYCMIRVRVRVRGLGFIIIIIINPLTARVVGAPQMILQPVVSIFPYSPLPSGTCRTPGLSIL